MAEEGTLLFQDHISIYDFCHNISMFLWGWESRTSSKLSNPSEWPIPNKKVTLTMKTNVKLFSHFNFTRNQKEIWKRKQAINQNQFDTGINRSYQFPSPVFCVSGLCTVLLVFVQGMVKCLFTVFFVLNPFFCECIILW